MWLIVNQLEPTYHNKHKMMESMHHHNSTNAPMIGNQSGEKHYLIKQFSYNRNIDEPFYSLLIALYSFLIILGSTGNILVVLAVLRNKQMQTARWIFWELKFRLLIDYWQIFSHPQESNILISRNSLRWILLREASWIHLSFYFSR